MKTFKHNLDNFGIANIDRAMGFIDCLREVLNYIEEVTEFKPEKKYINATELLDIIINTNNEFTKLLNRAEIELQKTLEV